jgi:hypothetical protein
VFVIESDHVPQGPSTPTRVGKRGSDKKFDIQRTVYRDIFSPKKPRDTLFLKFILV